MGTQARKQADLHTNTRGTMHECARACTHMHARMHGCTHMCMRTCAAHKETGGSPDHPRHQGSATSGPGSLVARGILVINLTFLVSLLTEVVRELGTLVSHKACELGIVVVPLITNLKKKLLVGGGPKTTAARLEKSCRWPSQRPRASTRRK